MLKNIIHEIGLKENRVYIIGKSEGVCYNPVFDSWVCKKGRKVPV